MGPRLARWTAHFRRMPRVWRGLLGIAAIALGVALTIHPTTAIGTLAYLLGGGMLFAGLLELTARSDDEDAARWRIASAVVWVLGGVFVLVWPGLTVRVAAGVVGAALIFAGVLGILAAFRRRHTVDARIADAAFGVSGVVFGVLALVWPDITLLVVAIVFGARVIMSGVVELWRAVRGKRRSRPRDDDDAEGGDKPRAQWGRTAVAVVAFALAVTVATVSGALQDASPVVDDFYAAPRDLPDEPGQLVRAEEFTRDVPEEARGWRILYTTTDEAGDVRAASALVVVPREGDGGWPVIDWTHGTTGYAQQCAPSLLAEPFESGALFALPAVIDEGWALVATDYIGLGTEGPHPYIVGSASGHAALDAVRAARQVAEADLGEQTVVWGHSQGGHAALWTGGLADTYAPDVPLSGVAALAPASNPRALTANLNNITGGSIFASFVVAAYTSIYDDVSFGAYVRPGAEVVVREMATRCLAEPGTLISALHAVGLSADPEIFRQQPTTGAFGRHLQENVPPASVSAPLLIAQGAIDTLVTARSQDEYVDTLCAAGQDVDYRRYAGREHVDLVQPGSALLPELFAWTRDRLDAHAADTGCQRAEVSAD